MGCTRECGDRGSIKGQYTKTWQGNGATLFTLFLSFGKTEQTITIPVFLAVLWSNATVGAKDDPSVAGGGGECGGGWEWG